MQFLKNYYEKIILVVLLIIFVALLVVQIVALVQTKSINISAILNIPEPSPDYEQVDFKKPEYDIAAVFPASETWLPNVKRGADPKRIEFTDLMMPYRLAVCPYCLKLIPAKCFPVGNSAVVDPKINVCNFCGKKLAPVAVASTVVDNDTNKNGVPDDVELKWGLNLEDPSAVEVDADNDGFNYLEEFRAGTDPQDPKLHPSFATKLLVERIDKSLINMIVKNVNVQNSDPNKWQVTVEINPKEYNAQGRLRQRMLTKGKEIEVPSIEDPNSKMTLKIVDIIRLVDKKIEKGVTVEINESQVVFQRVGTEDKIYATKNAHLYDLRESVTFLNTINEKLIVVSTKEKFTLGSKFAGEEVFTLVSCDKKSTTARIKREDGQIFTIQKHETETEDPNMMPPPEEMMPEPMSPRRPRRPRGGQPHRAMMDDSMLAPLPVR